MKLRTSAVVLTGAALAVALTGCGKSGTPSASGSGGAASDACTSSGVKFTPATPSITGSPTFDKIKNAGGVKVGVKADQPNLGYKDASGKRCGFDIEIAQMVAAGLGIDPSKIQYSEIPSANRESAIKGGQIDYYVGTYSITGKDTIKGKKVCSATGSTPIQRVRDEGLTEPSNIVEFKTYSECVSQLLDKKVDTVTTDDAILKGFAAQNPSAMKVVGKPFSIEKYGIGLPHDDKALRRAVNAILLKSFSDGTWRKIYDGM